MTIELSTGEVLRAIPAEAIPLVRAVLAAAKRKDADVYLVGGPVRDLLLGREIRDVDLLIASRGEGSASAAAVVAREAATADTKVVEHGRFGTVRLETSEATIDLASMRRERYERAGALPVVEPGSLEEDIQRRDFAVNALALLLSGADEGAASGVLDLVDGLADLDARRLRILHPGSFHDDPTRALRAARLGARLGFSLSRDSRSALRSALRDGAFGQVSGDRLRREIERCFGDAALGLDPAAALRLLADWHVLAALEPGLSLPRETVTALRRLGRAVASPPWRSPKLRPWVAGLSIWLAPLSPALRRRVLQRFAVRGDLVRRISDFSKLRDQRLVGLAKARGRGAVDAILEGTNEEELHALHASAQPAIRRRILRWAAEDRIRRSPVSGNDLMEQGLTGPAVGRAMARIRSAFLDGEVANREEAVALAEEIARSGARGRRALKGPRRKAPSAKRASKKRAGAERGRKKSTGAAKNRKMKRSPATAPQR